MGARWKGESGETPTAEALVAERPQPKQADRTAPVLVTGASGFVGTHVCKALAHRGWAIRAIARDPAKAMQRLTTLPAGACLDVRVGDLRDPETIRSAVGGAGAIVHLAAIAIERTGERYETSNTEPTRALVHAAQEAGVTRFIQMSQNGASSESPYRFLRSKGLAEDAVTASGLRWTVLRPSVIFGPEDEFVNVLARLVRLSPIAFPLPGGGAARFQPIAVDDVASAVARSLERPETIRGRFSIGGVAPLTLRQMTVRILIALRTRRLLLPIPISLLRPVVAVLQRILPTPPVTTGLLDLLSVDNTVPENALLPVFGVAPTPFAPEELTYLNDIGIRGALRSLFRNRG